jgi:hypothetical protein
MEKKMLAGAIVVIIVIVVAAAYALSMSGKASVSTTVPTTIQAPSSTPSTTLLPSTAFAAGCTTMTGFSCYNASITTYGQVSLSLLQKTNMTFYNVHVACIATGSASSKPVNGSSWYALSSVGTTKPSNFSGTTIYSGTVENMASLQCYNSAGMPFSTNGVQTFGGIVLLNYTASTAAVSSNNPWVTDVVATLNLTAK